MRKESNIGLYIGLLLVLGGIVCFLDLNGLLPGELFSQYINLIIGTVIFVAYLRNKKFYVLMISSFFIFNGLLLILDKWLIGWNYLAGVFLIPGLMFMVAFIAKKFLAYLVPGALLTSWGILHTAYYSRCVKWFFYDCRHGLYLYSFRLSSYFPL